MEWMWAGWAGTSISKDPWWEPIKHSIGTQEEKSTEPSRRWLCTDEEGYEQDNQCTGKDETKSFGRAEPSIYKSCLSQQPPKMDIALPEDRGMWAFKEEELLCRLSWLKHHKSRTEGDGEPCRGPKSWVRYSCGWETLRVTSQPVWRGACMMQKAEINPQLILSGTSRELCHTKSALWTSR